MKIKLLTYFVLFSSIFVLGNQPNGKFIKPQNVSTKIITIFGEEHFSYFPINSNKSTILNVKGPGKIKVISRATFPDEKYSTTNYKIYYKLDGGTKKIATFNKVNRSKIAKYQDIKLGFPGEDRSLIIEFGRGNHTIEIWRGNKSPKIAARYFFSKTSKKNIKWIDFSPLQPSEPVELVTEENLSLYYRFSSIKPLKTKIIGPTYLKILTRVENNYNMKGIVNYRFQVKEDGKIINTFLLNSSKSDVTIYKKDAISIPAKAKEIVITVPKGNHFYEIIPLDKDKPTLLGKLFLPKKDIHLEE